MSLPSSDPSLEASSFGSGTGFTGRDIRAASLAVLAPSEALRPMHDAARPSDGPLLDDVQCARTLCVPNSASAVVGALHPIPGAGETKLARLSVPRDRRSASVLGPGPAVAPACTTRWAVIESEQAVGRPSEGSDVRGRSAIGILSAASLVLGLFADTLR